MEISRVKHNMGEKVFYNGTEYMLTGCIIRRNIQGQYFYQAELQDLSAKHSVVICSLDEIREREQE